MDVVAVVEILLVDVLLVDVLLVVGLRVVVVVTLPPLRSALIIVSSNEIIPSATLVTLPESAITTWATNDKISLITSRIEVVPLVISLITVEILSVMVVRISLMESSTFFKTFSRIVGRFSKSFVADEISLEIVLTMVVISLIISAKLGISPNPLTILLIISPIFDRSGRDEVISLLVRSLIIHSPLPDIKDTIILSKSLARSLPIVELPFAIAVLIPSRILVMLVEMSRLVLDIIATNTFFNKSPTSLRRLGAISTTSWKTSFSAVIRSLAIPLHLVRSPEIVFDKPFTRRSATVDMTVLSFVMALSIAANGSDDDEDVIELIELLTAAAISLIASRLCNSTSLASLVTNSTSLIGAGAARILVQRVVSNKPLQTFAKIILKTVIKKRVTVSTLYTNHVNNYTGNIPYILKGKGDSY